MRNQVAYHCTHGVRARGHAVVAGWSGPLHMPCRMPWAEERPRKKAGGPKLPMLPASARRCCRQPVMRQAHRALAVHPHRRLGIIQIPVRPCPPVQSARSMQPTYLCARPHTQGRAQPGGGGSTPPLRTAAPCTCQTTSTAPPPSLPLLVVLTREHRVAFGTCCASSVSGTPRMLPPPGCAAREAYGTAHRGAVGGRVVAARRGLQAGTAHVR